MSIILRRAALPDLPAILKLNNAMCLDEHNRYDALIIPNFATAAGRKYFKSRLSDQGKRMKFS
jgi:hypothetical protein